MLGRQPRGLPQGYERGGGSRTQVLLAQEAEGRTIYPSAVDNIEEIYQKAWKDGHWGIVLFASDKTEECTRNLVECPQGRVPKQLPDRSISTEGRPIHAMMTAN